MFKLRYNILVVAQILIYLINYIFIIKIFNISNEVDAYFIGLSILASLQLLITMPFEQFMFFYNDLKTKSAKQAHCFLNMNLNLSVMVGLTMFFLLCLLVKPIIGIFAYSLDAERVAILKNLLYVNFFTAMFYPIIATNEKFFTAELKISYSYALQILPFLFINFSLIYSFITKDYNIYYLAFAQAVGVMLSALLGVLIVHKMKVPLKFKPLIIKLDFLKKYFKNSISMKIGHNIHGVLSPIIINNILAMMPAGFVSLFYYGKRIADATNMISVGPSSKVLLSKVSDLWSKRKKEEILNLIKTFIPKSSLIFAAVIAGTLVISPFIIDLISNGVLLDNQINLIIKVFLVLSVWYFIVLIEFPYVFINLASKRSSILIYVNSCFITLFFIFSFLLKGKMSILALPAAACMAQSVAFLFHRTLALKALATLDNES